MRANETTAVDKDHRRKAKPDLRVVKTKRAIREAFKQLIAEKPFAGITVQDIIDRAMVNRKTFYNHFSDKYDLAEQIMRDIGNDLRNTAEQVMRKGKASHLSELYETLQGFRVEVLALWDVKTPRGESLSGLLADILAEMYLDQAEREQMRGDVQLQSRMYATIATATLKFILESNGAYAFDDLQQALVAIPRVMFVER